ncbi:MerR family transcriptional regulator [Micromonospora sp. NPDC049047]|uniref:MerR family transcriptional regulator n=1 Tax=Micromonospora sp. NPDC049047 TaxID=3155645 RepID=UPI0033C21438
MQESLRTGELARLAGVNIQTLRYYERRGLLTPPARSHGGHRLYPRDAVDRVRKIKLAQRLGFKLDEIPMLIDVPRRTLPRGLTEQFEGKLAEIDQRIHHLQEIRSQLLEVVRAGCSSVTDCRCGLGDLLHTAGHHAGAAS